MNKTKKTLLSVVALPLALFILLPAVGVFADPLKWKDSAGTKDLTLGSSFAIKVKAFGTWVNDKNKNESVLYTFKKGSEEFIKIDKANLETLNEGGKFVKDGKIDAKALYAALFDYAIKNAEQIKVTYRDKSGNDITGDPSKDFTAKADVVLPSMGEMIEGDTETNSFMKQVEAVLSNATNNPNSEMEVTLVGLKPVEFELNRNNGFNLIPETAPRSGGGFWDYQNAEVTLSFADIHK